jgi:hypothetical protein
MKSTEFEAHRLRVLSVVPPPLSRALTPFQSSVPSAASGASAPLPLPLSKVTPAEGSSASSSQRPLRKAVVLANASRVVRHSILSAVHALTIFATSRSLRPRAGLQSSMRVLTS